VFAIDLHDRISFVTGGARGIGRACAEALARAGSRIALADLDEASAAATADAIAKEYSVATRGYACDVRDPVGIRATVDAVAVDFGALDHVINNAGVQYVSPIDEFPDDMYDLVRGVDLDGVFHTTKAVWKHLVARGRGRIVNIASVHALVASPFKAAYISSKHGVLGLTKASAIEGAAHGITVNAICPGAVMTDLVRGQAADLARSYGGGITEEEALERAFLEEMPTRRFIDVSEVGALCAFLCSDYAVSITGAPIAIDGGWSAH
jgi:3-hydroxybutyrate dehydrogenase